MRRSNKTALAIAIVESMRMFLVLAVVAGANAECLWININVVLRQTLSRHPISLRVRCYVDTQKLRQFVLSSAYPYRISSFSFSLSWSTVARHLHFLLLLLLLLLCFFLLFRAEKSRNWIQFMLVGAQIGPIYFTQTHKRNVMETKE